MKKIFAALLLPAAALAGGNAFAQGQIEAQAPTDTVFDAPFNVNARAGILDYNAGTDFLTGLTVDWQASKLYGQPMQDQKFQWGVTTGVLYSPLEPSPGDVDAFIVPTDVYAGYQLTNKIFVSGHGGANWYLGDADAVTGGDDIALNLGLGAGYALTQSIAITSRADWSFTDGENPFMLTGGVTIPLG